MKILSSVLAVAVLTIALCMMSIGCGVTKKKTDEVQKHIQLLQQKGVPDSMLSDAKVLLVQIQSSKQYGGGASPQKLYDSAVAVLAKADAAFTATTNQLKPVVEALRQTFDARKQGLTGPQLKEADSLIKLADSCIRINQWPEAKEKCTMIDATLNSLLKDETTAKELKPKIIGTWNATRKTADKETKANYVEKTTFTFTSDGKADCIEEKNGQTNEVFKEDWKFQSSGTFSLKGDTVMMSLPREKCIKQTYWNNKDVGGKKQWVKDEKPTYDSTVTSDKKYRFVSYADLKANFKKK
jgi:hypothetical protein